MGCSPTNGTGRNTLFFVTIQGANGLDDLKETRTAILRENTHPGRSGRFIQQVGWEDLLEKGGPVRTEVERTRVTREL